MKLMEIISPPVKDVETPVIAYVKGRAEILGDKFTYKGKKIEILGVGVEGVVYKLEDEPNVIKVLAANTENLGKIPYLQYILTLSKYAKENPYFPRITRVSEIPINPSEYNAVIHNIVKNERKREWVRNHIPKKALIFKIEPLIPIREVTREESQLVWKKIYNEEMPSKLTVIEAYMNLGDDIERAAKGNQSLIKDPLLLQAILLIKKVRAKTNASFDIHSDNIMLRRTPHGMQLVITDPLVSFVT